MKSLRAGFKVLKFGCVNVNSLLSKDLYSRHWIGECELNVVAVCEIWLVVSVSSYFVSIDGFKVVHVNAFE